MRRRRDKKGAGVGRGEKKEKGGEKEEKGGKKEEKGGGRLRKV